jgi:hypothetical protein
MALLAEPPAVQARQQGLPPSLLLALRVLPISSGLPCRPALASLLAALLAGWWGWGIIILPVGRDHNTAREEGAVARGPGGIHKRAPQASQGLQQDMARPLEHSLVIVVIFVPLIVFICRGACSHMM